MNTIDKVLPTSTSSDHRLYQAELLVQYAQLPLGQLAETLSHACLRGHAQNILRHKIVTAREPKSV